MLAEIRDEGMTGRQFVERANRFDPAFGHQHHDVRQPDDFGHGVADVDDRDGQLVAQAFDERQDLVLARLIECGQGFVQEQQARIENVRAIARKTNREVAILGDLQGPKIRIARFKTGSVCLKKKC